MAGYTRTHGAIGHRGDGQLSQDEELKVVGGKRVWAKPRDPEASS